MIRFLRPFDPHRLRLLVFDLDGTLVDSRLDSIHSVNATMPHLGRPELEGDVIASYVGDGAPALVRRALGNGNKNDNGNNNDNNNDDGENDATFRAALEYFLGSSACTSSTTPQFMREFPKCWLRRNLRPASIYGCALE